MNGMVQEHTGWCCVMTEMIHFTIAYGDTSDPLNFAKELAREHEFSEWLLRKVRDVCDDGIVSTKWRLEGWKNDLLCKE